MNERHEIISWVCDWGIWDNTIEQFIGTPINSYYEADIVLIWLQAIN